MRAAILIAIALGACSAETIDAERVVSGPADLVIAGGRIVDVTTGEIIEGKSIVVRGNRIESIVSSSEVPVAALTFNADGRFVIPGLWDMHAHALYDRWPLSDEGTVYTWGPYMDLMLAHGITGFRDMWGSPGTIRLARAEIASGERIGPRFVAAGAVFGWFPYFAGLERAETADEAIALVRKAHADGADFIKFGVYNPAYLLQPVVTEARNFGLDVVGHVPPDMSAVEAAALGMRSIEHSFGVLQGCTPEGESLFDAARQEFAESRSFSFPLILHSHPLLADFDEQKCAAQARELAALDVWLGPTVALWEAKAKVAGIDIEADPRFQLVNAEDRKAWLATQQYYRNQELESGGLARRLYEVRLRVIRTMHENGVPILAGSDFMNLAATPGIGLMDELRNYQLAGLSALDALRTATIEPARYLRRTKEFGTVEVDRIADLVVLERNPLDDIDNVATTYAVVANGTLLDRATLDRLAETAMASLGN